MVIKVVSSSSKGNLTIIKLSNQKVILIDCGVGITKLKKELNQSLNIQSIDYLFLTHGHQDHIQGLASIVKKFPPKIVYLSNATLNLVKDIFYDYQINYQIIKRDQELITEDFSLLTIGANHDFPQTMGFIFHIDGKKLSYLTDSGFVDYEYLEAMKDSDLIFLEANHDETMLNNDISISYPLKKRISGPLGHLSNDSFCIVLDNIITKPTIVIAMHISQERNQLKLVQDCFNRQIKRKYKVDLYLSTSVEFDSLKSIIL